MTDTRHADPAALTDTVAQLLAEHAADAIALLLAGPPARIDLDEPADVDEDTCAGCGAPATHGCTWTGDHTWYCARCHHEACLDPACA